MNWNDVCTDPSLQNLPFKIELNQWGQVVRSPVSNRHGRNQMAIGLLLGGLRPGGEIISECSIDTPQGVKVADVAWASDAFMAAHGFVTPYPRAPEICVEIVSPSNLAAELQEKTGLYLDAGASEVWLCTEDGTMSFFDVGGEIPRSQLFPGFPARV